MAKRKRRNFTPEFKAEVVLEALSGESSQAEVCRRLYCHRKFRPLSKPRLCYNNNLLGRSIRWRTKRRRFTPEFKAEVVIEALSGENSQAELCRKPHNLSADQLSKWKQQLLENAATLFESTDKQSDASIERIAQLEQLVGRLTLALEIQKKASTLLS